MALKSFNVEYLHYCAETIILSLKQGNYMLQRPEISKESLKQAIQKMQEVAKHRGDGALDLMNAYIRSLIDAPASTDPKYGNAIEGGFVDERYRILLVARNICEGRGINTSIADNPSFASLAFLCFFGDIGLLGIDPNTPLLVDSEAWMKKRGQLYQRNPHHPNMAWSDVSLYLLNKYGIKMNQTEFLGVRISGGIHLEENRHYASLYRGSTLLDGLDGIVRIYLMAKELVKQDLRELCV